jgi:hypothetical protein
LPFSAAIAFCQLKASGRSSCRVKNTPTPQLNRIVKDIVVDFLKDLWGFMKERKKFWLLPIILSLLFFGALIVFTSGTAIAPFIYTLP